MTSPPRGVVFDLDGTLYETPVLMRPRIALRLFRDLDLLRALGASRAAIRARVFDGDGALHEALYTEIAARSRRGPVEVRT